MSRTMEKALANKKEHKKGTKPNFAAIHGDRHNRSKLHAQFKPQREAALNKKMSLADMHSAKGTETFKKLGAKGQEDFAKKDRDASRAAMIKKLEAAGDFESAKMLKGS